MPLGDIWNFIDAQTRPRSQPRPLDDFDREGLFAAAMEQDRQPRPRINSQQDLIQWLYTQNPVRMRRMRKDFAWMQRQLRKIHRNPEDARWLL